MQVPTLSWLEDELQAATAPTPASGGAAPTTLDLSVTPPVVVLEVDEEADLW